MGAYIVKCMRFPEAKCPNCGSGKATKEVIYGLPDGPLDESRFFTGGCCVSEKDPTRICLDCGSEWDFVNNVESNFL